MAEALREEGNAHFRAGNFLKAAAVYTKALQLDPENCSLFSNRSAAYLNLSKVTKAVADAEMAIKLNPQWEKGYFRKGCALEVVERYEDALETYKEGLLQNPKSAEVSTKIKKMSQLIRDKTRKTAAQSNVTPNGSTTSLNLEKLNSDFDESKREQALLKFALKVIENAVKEWTETGKLNAGVHFSVGKSEAPSLVQISQAFESPDTLTNCVSYLRQHATETDSDCACVVVPKSSIAFPQVWKGSGSRKWKHSQDDGFFVQLEASSLRKAWFVSSSGSDVKECRDIESLEIDLHAVVPPLFR